MVLVYPVRRLTAWIKTTGVSLLARNHLPRLGRMKQPCEGTRLLARAWASFAGEQGQLQASGALEPGLTDSHGVRVRPAMTVAPAAASEVACGRLPGREAERLGMGPAVVLGQDLAEVPGPVGDGAVADLAARDRKMGNGHREAAGT